MSKKARNCFYVPFCFTRALSKQQRRPSRKILTFMFTFWHILVNILLISASFFCYFLVCSKNKKIKRTYRRPRYVVLPSAVVHAKIAMPLSHPRGFSLHETLAWWHSSVWKEKKDRNVNIRNKFFFCHLTSHLWARCGYFTFDCETKKKM